MVISPSPLPSPAAAGRHAVYQRDVDHDQQFVRVTAPSLPAITGDTRERCVGVGDSVASGWRWAGGPFGATTNA